MNKDLEKLAIKIGKNFDQAKATEKPDNNSYSGTSLKTVFGDIMSWNNPNLVWILCSVTGGGYEESGSQLGITRSGKIVFEYQSHCSCNSFEDSHGQGDGDLFHELTKKTYEVSSLPKDWEKIVKVNCETILKEIKK